MTEVSFNQLLTDVARELADLLRKYNPYHDPRTGRFTFSPSRTDTSHTQEVMGKWREEVEGRVGDLDTEEGRGKLKAEVVENLGATLEEKVGRERLAQVARRWMEEWELSDLIGEDDAYEIRETLKGLPPEQQVVGLLIDAWAVDSGGIPLSLALQRAAAKELGGNSYPREARENSLVRKRLEEVWSEDEDVIRGFVRSVYDHTQRELEARGIEELVLYRGVRVKQEKPAGYTQTGTSPASSFTTDYETAKSFAEDTITRTPAVAVMRIPRSRVLSTYMTGIGCASEKEVVVSGRGLFRAGFVYGSQNIESEDLFWERLEGAKAKKVFDFDSDKASANWPKRTDDRLSSLWGGSRV